MKTAVLRLQKESSLTQQEKIRRTIILCQSFGRNLAYYRVGQEPLFKELLEKKSSGQSFFRQINSNFLDIAVLEWCKLFGDSKQSSYYFGKLLTQPQSFKSKLELCPEFAKCSFDQYVNAMKLYRDKFVAHLDGKRHMYIPSLDAGCISVRLYHKEIVEREADFVDLSGLCDTTEKFDLGYEECLEEARGVLKSIVD